jgi:arylsulfatase
MAQRISDGPNILLICCDQLRADALGCYGNPVVRTPHLDRLADSGVRCTRSYVANPICMPNRVSLFTGQYPRNHGMWTNGLLLQHEPRTLADDLRDAGYQTASFGKLHFTPYGGEAGNRESAAWWKALGDDCDWTGPYWGFEQVELTIGHTLDCAHYGRWFRAHGGTPEMRRRHSVCGTPDSGVRDMPISLHDTAFVAERTAAFLREERDASRPFFCVASFPDPHHPFDPPREAAAWYPYDSMPPAIGGPDDLATRPAHYRQQFVGAWNRKGVGSPACPDGLPEAQRRERTAHTCAMVDLIDRGVGEIMQALDVSGQRENTLVIFTADHGELLGDHGLWYKGPFFYEGLLRVPLLVSWPGALAPGVSDALVSTVDLAPTVLDYLGRPIPAGVNGRSQRPHLENRGRTVRDHCLVEYRTGYGAADVASAALITRDAKYVRYQTGEEELTDLAADPEERRNVAADPAYQSQAQALRAALLDTLLATQMMEPAQISHA